MYESQVTLLAFLLIFTLYYSIVKWSLRLASRNRRPSKRGGGLNLVGSGDGNHRNKGGTGTPRAWDRKCISVILYSYLHRHSQVWRVTCDHTHTHTGEGAIPRLHVNIDVSWLLVASKGRLFPAVSELRGDNIKQSTHRGSRRIQTMVFLPLLVLVRLSHSPLSSGR